MHRPFRFAPPPLPGIAVARPRLLAPLGRRFELRLVAVEAGPGLGKTTLLAQAVAENRLAPRGRDAWLTCEPADSSPTRLLSALLSALGVEDPDSPNLETLCEAVWAAAPEHVCLVVDDAHHLEQGSGGADTLRQLSEALPENGHLVVAARALPPLGRARLLAQGRCAQLSADDLRLDHAEVAVIADGHGVAPALLEPAGGWPALAELYARTGRVDVERFVWEDVLADLPEADREAFLSLVAVGGADAGVLQALSEQPFDAERLAALPLVAADAMGGLRPHPLWEDLVGNRLSPERSHQVRRRLAAALRTRGDDGGAFELLARDGEWDAALEAVFDACSSQRRPPSADEMQRWLAMIPDLVAHRPEVAFVRAMHERARDPWSPAAGASFAKATAGFQASGDVLREVTCSVRASQIAWVSGDVATLVGLRARAIELRDAGLPLGPVVDLNAAVTADLEGRVDDVLALCVAIDGLEPRLRHLPFVLRVFFARLTAGDPEGARLDAADAAQAAGPVSPAAGTGWAALAPALVAWGAGEIGRALTLVAVAHDERQSIAERVPTLALSVLGAAHVGNTAEAEAGLARIDQLLAHAEVPDLLAGFRAVAGAAVAVANGDEGLAAEVVAAHLGSKDLLPGTAGRAIRWWPALPYLLHAPARRMVDGLDSGRSRTRALATCRALLAARAGAEWSEAELLDDPEALLTVLPARLAAEAVAHAAGSGESRRAEAAAARLADLAPTATRDALHALSSAADPRLAAGARTLLATVAIPPPHRLRIEVLGPARVLRDGAPAEDPLLRRQRVREVLCTLVARPEIRRARLGVLLWPEFDERGVSQNLRTTLSYVQSVLEPDRARGDVPWFLQQDANVLRLRRDDRLSVDAWELTEHLDAAASAAVSGLASVELTHLLAAVDLWRGEYLEDLSGLEWAEPEREVVRARFARGAARACSLLLAAGRRPEAVRVARVLAAADPWSDDARNIEAAALGAADPAG